jgi:hypothetical protein
MNLSIFPKPDGPSHVWRGARMIGTLAERIQPDNDMMRHAVSLGIPDCSIGTVEQLTGTVLVIRGAQELEFYAIKAGDK